jgi:hypothetical protein
MSNKNKKNDKVKVVVKPVKKDLKPAKKDIKPLKAPIKKDLKPAKKVEEKSSKKLKGIKEDVEIKNKKAKSKKDDEDEDELLGDEDEDFDDEDEEFDDEEEVEVSTKKSKRSSRDDDEEEEEEKNKDEDEDEDEDEDAAKPKGKRGRKPSEAKKGDDDFEAFDDEAFAGDDFEEDFKIEDFEEKGFRGKAAEEVKELLTDDVVSLGKEFDLDTIFTNVKTINFFSSDSDECLERGCDNPGTTMGFCRFHYIKIWKLIKRKEEIFKDGKLQKVIEELVKKYPVKYIEAVMNDLVDDKTFFQALKEMNIESSEEDFFDEAEAGEEDEEDIAFARTATVPRFESED